VFLLQFGNTINFLPVLETDGFTENHTELEVLKLTVSVQLFVSEGCAKAISFDENSWKKVVFRKVQTDIIAIIGCRVIASYTSLRDFKVSICSFRNFNSIAVNKSHKLKLPF